MMQTRLTALALTLLALGCSPRTRPADVVACTPGTMLQVGCADAIGRFCSGDPEIRVCEGSTLPADCIEGAATQLAFDDDSGGSQCPVAQLLCPSSGHITVVPDGSSVASWVCPWAVGTIPVSDRPAETLSCTPGAMLAAGCDGTVGSLCRGDPTIRVCEGSLTPAACIAGMALVQDDDGGATGLCPLGRFTCPPSGRITVVPQGFGMRPPADWDCLWDIGVPAI
jgi:hypothetical protein